MTEQLRRMDEARQPFGKELSGLAGNVQELLGRVKDQQMTVDSAVERHITK